MGHDGQYDGIQVSIQIYCPSCPIVPWTGWTVQWNSVYSHLPYPTAHPILGSLNSIMDSKCPSCPIVLQTGWTVQ